MNINNIIFFSVASIAIIAINSIYLVLGYRKLVIKTGKLQSGLLSLEQDFMNLVKMINTQNYYHAKYVLTKLSDKKTLTEAEERRRKLSLKVIEKYEKQYANK